MTTTVNPDCGHDERCFIANSKLKPDCFKLRLGYDPSTASYDLALCNPNIVFTNVCCLNTVGNNVSSNIILRIPLSFSQDCFLYRANLFTSAGRLENVGVFVGVDVFPLQYHVSDGYLNIVIPAMAIESTQNGEGQCVSTIIFDRFSIPLKRIANSCDCCPLCPSIDWAFGAIITPL